MHTAKEIGMFVVIEEGEQWIGIGFALLCAYSNNL